MPRERHHGVAAIRLRQRSADHPMIMFFVLAAAVFLAMALVPPTSGAFASFGALRAAAPASRPSLPEPDLLQADLACIGQAWGAENADCLATISRNSGRPDGGKVRVITGA
ncbi:hypothetical protein ABUE31_07135 [Mesorhizobium sp. ZMM04-5]|uniref:Uncharacterized protein n=1 Tax=Mesorhizobium marinum TaxID=3228790 RepID=A0ABV3QY92_9HYPH